MSVGLENQSRTRSWSSRAAGRSAGQTRHDESRDHFLFRAQLTVRADPGVITPIRMDLGPDAYRYSPDLPAYASNCGVATIEDAGALTRPGERCRAHPPDLAGQGARARLHQLRRPGIQPAAGPAGPRPGPARLRQRPGLVNRGPGPGPRCPQGGGPARVRRGGRQVRRRHPVAGARPAAAAGLPADQQDHARARRALAPAARGLAAVPAGVPRQPAPGAGLAGAPGVRLHPGTVGRPVVGRPDRGGERPVVPDSRRENGSLPGAHGVLPVLRPRPREVPAEPAPGAGFRCGCCPCSRPSGSSTSWPSPTRSGRRRRPGGCCARRAAALGAPFRVGFYAGGANTPNSLSDAGLLDRLRRDEAARRRYRLVDRCPYCRSRNVTVRPPDPVQLRLIIACDGCGRDLPIVVTDREIYRYLPAVVVGTLDKLAAIGLSDRVRVPPRRRRLRLRAARLRARRQVPRARSRPPRRAAAPARPHRCTTRRPPWRSSTSCTWSTRRSARSAATTKDCSPPPRRCCQPGPGATGAGSA